MEVRSLGFKPRASLAATGLAALALFAPPGAAAAPLGAGPLVQVSGASPIPAACIGDANASSTSVNFYGTEVEPYVMVDPSNPNVLVGAWQQDRWNDGASRGIVTARSTNGGASWTINANTKSSVCTGGTAANGGGYERASDPWVAISPNGTAYLMTLSTDQEPGGLGSHPNAMLIMRSTDHGATWGNPTTLIRDESQNVLNDKNSMTADPNDPSFAYAVWDRLISTSANASQQAFETSIDFSGDVYFSRTTNGGASWEPARRIYKAGQIAQTIGNLIVVLPTTGGFHGELIDVFTQTRAFKNSQNTRGTFISAIRSADHGATWTNKEVTIAPFPRGVVSDPDDGAPHRTGDINPEAAVDPNTGAIYVIWQDSSFGPRSSIALSRSTDGGLTWSTPIKVNATPTTIPLGNQQAFTPNISVNNAGTVAVSYYDFRNNTADAGATTPTDAFVVHCHAATENCAASSSWDEETRTTDTSFDSRQAPIARGFFLGDYEGLGTDGTSFFSFFAMSSAADHASIFTRKVG
jgi:hypothetical protein